MTLNWNESADGDRKAVLLLFLALSPPLWKRESQMSYSIHAVPPWPQEGTTSSSTEVLDTDD